jgi:lipid II:glycine glycyltransferase (peptidoglycan interpeptide bridge formation enzyme)
LSRIKLESDSAVVASRFHSHHVRQLKKAQKNDALRVERGTGPDSLQQFYRVHVQTRQRLGLPVQPRRFFRLLGEHIMQPGLGHVALAYDNDECVAADVFFHWKDTITYKYSAGTDAAKESRANFLLIWDTIQWGCDRGYCWLDLGRSEESNAGLRTFKARWGTEETPLTYTSVPANPVDPRQSRLIPTVHAIIRRSPEWVCRVMGELFYKYVG